MRVTRGSSCILKSTSLPAVPRCRSSVVSSSSAFSTMVRNLNSRNSRPSRSDACLREEDRSRRSTRGSPPRCASDARGCSRISADDRDDELGGALREPLSLAVARRLDVDQREPGDGAGLDARAGDIDDARREHEVLPAGLEHPRDPLDAGRGELVGAGDRDGVGAECRPCAVASRSTPPRSGIVVPSTVPPSWCAAERTRRRRGSRRSGLRPQRFGDLRRRTARSRRGARAR